MSVQEASYYSFSKVRETSPEAQDWAAVDGNWELLSLILKVFENHHHTGVAAIRFPGYNAGTPATPTLATLTEDLTDGVLNPGTNVGVRISYFDVNGLETDSSPEISLQLSAAAERPLTPQLSSTQTLAGALPGGTYLYVITKVKGSGETTMSDVLPVTVSYDQTYSVTLLFDAIDTYTDGTEGINIYRSTGLNSSFQLVGEVTDTDQTTYIDTNTIDPANLLRQPPSVPTFDATRRVLIDWTAFTYPTGAYKMRVYVTQEYGIWGTDNVLFEQVINTGSPVDSIYYRGDETLSTGWPKESSQIPSSAAKLDLTTEASGGVVATAASNFGGQYVNNMRLGPAPTVTVTNGMIWYDTTANQIKARVNGSDVTLAQAGASYSHGAESSGGHIAANIPFISGSAVNMKTVSDYVVNTTSGVRETKQTVWRAVGTGGLNTTSSTVSAMTGMDLVLTQPNALEFNNQWVEITFDAEFQCNVPLATVTIGFEVNGVTVADSLRTITSPNFVSVPFKASFFFAQQFASKTTTYTLKPVWGVSAGATLSANSTHRIFFAKRVF